MILHHWTHAVNLRSIHRKGLDPSYATGQMKAVWAVQAAMVEWGLVHISRRHAWEPDDMVLLRFEVPRTLWKRFSTWGVWWIKAVVPVVDRCVARNLDGTTWVDLTRFLNG